MHWLILQLKSSCQDELEMNLHPSIDSSINIPPLVDPTILKESIDISIESEVPVSKFTLYPLFSASVAEFTTFTFLLLLATNPAQTEALTPALPFFMSFSDNLTLTVATDANRQDINLDNLHLSPTSADCTWFNAGAF